ncbi:pyruvate dehydrogenase complex dihydrolipoamide acetyltransferase [Candidatus Ponderosibacter sp. Uisw_141_02]|jgi:pyruvate dehydrogenase E2 component (dihydrolipoamide acetyltransferase)|uniref:pyruvate dehydrogenase complex dihydrolipoamide acetyltransferase n=1 Tax=Candidatus Ponderosibacter sp. Uisw_141_02 TaxID=3231000 RepID=UPI003D42A66C
MAIEIKMPALSPTMTTGTLAKWLVGEGDRVNSGDVIAEIETDKATMEVESVDDGVMAKIFVDAGTENVAVGAVIAVLAEDGETASDVAKAGLQEPSSPVPVTSVAAEAKERAEPAPVTAAPVKAVPAPKTKSSDKPRIFASPLARRIAADRNIALEGITGSGPYGRILRRDVESAATAPIAQTTAALAGATQQGDSYLVANSQMRKAIASRLQDSKQQAPHFYLTVDCVIDNLLEARKSLNAKAAEGIKISVNDMIIRAAAMALIAVPEANASWEGENTRLFRHADIAMAVAIDGGLITPIVWAAEQKGLAALSQVTTDLAARARDGKLAANEYTGGSFTISNLGMFGVREFAAVINPPHGGILAVGAGEQRPIVIDGNLAVATVMSVTLSADHRAVDGAVGARWLQAFKGFVENPVTMLL